MNALLLWAQVGHFWEYNGLMDIVNYEHNQMIGVAGTCPFCDTKSLLSPKQSFLQARPRGGGHVIVSIVQCEACKEYALAQGSRQTSDGPFKLEKVYPAGSANDTVDLEVPSGIREELSEAIRCNFIKSYKGTVVLCRRAVQAALLQLGAKKRHNAKKQIDWVFKKGLITKSLQEFAHEIRLTGNDGAHPDPDNLENVTPKDAADMIQFTKDFLNYIYVMPARLRARKTSEVN